VSPLWRKVAARILATTAVLLTIALAWVWIYAAVEGALRSYD